MTAPNRRCFWFTLWTLCVMIVAGLLVAGAQLFIADMKEREERTEKLLRTSYMLDGTVNPESERGKGLFTDPEIDSIKADAERLSRASSLRPNLPAPH